MKIHASPLCLSMLAMLLMALPGAGAAAAQDIWADLARMADACSEAHDYDPRAPGNVGKHEIAPAEPAWRACMYDRIETTIVRKSPAAAEWRALIEADRAMTAQIEAGTMTREERAASLQVKIAQIQLAEIAATARRIEETRQRLEFMDQIDQIRRDAAPRFF